MKFNLHALDKGILSLLFLKKVCTYVFVYVHVLCAYMCSVVCMWCVCVLVWAHVLVYMHVYARVHVSAMFMKARRGRQMPQD